ncbi:MAG: helix-turn-helix domain-containing protein [Verrucomicrobiales bacterium]
MKTSPPPLHIAPQNPEWLRIVEACEYARVSKPVIYDWMNKGWIKNVSLRQRGQIKGVRLVSFDSLRAFLESRATGGIETAQNDKPTETR